MEEEIAIQKLVTEKNDQIADKTNEYLSSKNILCINLMGSPGAGKTTLIENIANHIDPSEIAVIQGDLESDIDTKRLSSVGIYTHQINTHSGCHLNSTMVKEAVDAMKLDEKKFLIIENVGNLVCPAGVKVGAHLNIIASSTTEGSDKPKKYPVIFLDAHLIAITKTDLENAVGFKRDQYLSDIKGINPHAPVVFTTKGYSESFKEIADFLRKFVSYN